MKIAVINQPLANRGDEAAHKAFIRAMSKAFPEYQIDVIFLCVEQSLINFIKVEEENVSYINIPRVRGFVRFEQIGFLFDNFSFSYFHIPTLHWRQALGYRLKLAAFSPDLFTPFTPYVSTYPS